VAALLALEDMGLGSACPEEAEEALIEVIAEAAESESAFSESSFCASLGPALSWLADPAIREEQRQRAEEIKRSYEAKGFRPAKKVVKKPKAGVSGANTAPAGEEETSCPAKRREALKGRVRAALEPLTKKHNSYRNVLKGVNMLKRNGLLDTEGTSVTVRGSHITLHQKHGCSTFVKDHRGTAPLRSKDYMQKMERLIDVCAGA